jgi:putative transcriptional regulator
VTDPGLDGGYLQGRLLVADPRLSDPNFERAVVLLLAHGTEGAVGVVLNRPGEVEVRDALYEWGHLTCAPAVVFVGGPVEPGGVICLARRSFGPGTQTAGRAPDEPFDAERDAPTGWSRVVGSIGVFHVEDDPPEPGGEIEELRFFAGYAGWAAGQLEAEIEAGGWFVLDAVATDALSPRPSQLWRDVLRRQRSSLALVAAYPADPEMN